MSKTANNPRKVDRPKMPRTQRISDKARPKILGPSDETSPLNSSCKTIPECVKTATEQTNLHLVILVGKISRSLISFFLEESTERYHLAIIDVPECLPSRPDWTKIGLSKPVGAGTTLSDLASFRGASEELWGKLLPQLAPILKKAHEISVIANLGDFIGTIGAVAVTGLIFNSGRDFQTLVTVPEYPETKEPPSRIVQWALECLSLTGNVVRQFPIAASRAFPGGAKRARTSWIDAMNAIAADLRGLKRPDPVSSPSETERDEDPSEAISEFDETCSLVTPDFKGTLIPIRHSMDRFFKKLLHQHRSQENIGLISREIWGFNQFIGTLGNSILAFIASSNRLGRSTFLANLVLHTCLTLQRGVLYFSNEGCSEVQLTSKLLTQFTGIDKGNLKVNNLKVDDLELLKEAGEKLDGCSLYIDPTPGNTVSQIRNTVLQHLNSRVDNKPLGLIIVDNFQFISEGPDSVSANHPVLGAFLEVDELNMFEGLPPNRRKEAIANKLRDKESETRVLITQELKRLSAAVQVPVICGIHDKRYLIDMPSKPPAPPLAPASGEGEDLIDLICVLKRIEAPSASHPKCVKTEVIVEKNSHGGGGTYEIDLFPTYSKSRE